MTLQDIRRKAGYSANAKATLKQHARAWLCGTVERQYELGLTVMPRKLFVKQLPSYYNTKKTAAYRHMNKQELVNAAERLMAILSRLVFRNGYVRHGKKLNIIYSIEGEASCKDLHLHFAIGGKPGYLKFWELGKLIEEALRVSDDFVTVNEGYREGVDDINKKYGYKIDIIDSGWMDYITKELNKNCIDNLRFV